MKKPMANVHAILCTFVPVGIVERFQDWNMSQFCPMLPLLIQLNELMLHGHLHRDCHVKIHGKLLLNLFCYEAGNRISLTLHIKAEI